MSKVFGMLGGHCHLHICPRNNDNKASDSCHTIIFNVPLWTKAHSVSSSCRHMTTCWLIGARSAVTRERALVAGATSELSLPSACQSQASIWPQLLWRARGHDCGQHTCLSMEFNSMSAECMSSPPIYACVHAPYTHTHTGYVTQHLLS